MLLLVTAIVAGFAGPTDPLSNFAPVFVLIVFWVGMAFASVLFGDVFRAFNPWRAAGRVLIRTTPRPYPERPRRLARRACALLVFTWIELASGWGEHPARLAAAATAYSLLTWAGDGASTASRRGPAAARRFSVYFNLLCRLSIFEKRGHEVGRRPLLHGLPPLERVPGTVGFVVVMIGTVTFDGLSQGALWKSLSGGARRRLRRHDRAAARRRAGRRLLPARDGWAPAPSAATSRRTTLARAFVHSLVPIAAVYVAAHYLTFLIFEGQAIRYTAVGPVRPRAGTCSAGPATGINYGVLSQNADLVPAGRRSSCSATSPRSYWRTTARSPSTVRRGLAVRSQYWMLGIMIGFTTMALWLLAQAGS